MKFTFKSEPNGTELEDNHPTVTYEAQVVTLDEALESFQGFLLGVGFSPELVKELFS